MLCGKPICERHKVIKEKTVMCVECGLWKPNVYYGCGLLVMVDVIASHEFLMAIPNWLPQYFAKSDKAFHHAVFNINWCKRLENETIPDLNDVVETWNFEKAINEFKTVKENITELMENMENELWVNWLIYIDKVWMDFWIEDKENSPNGLKVLEYDKFFREQCITRNVKMPKILRQTPNERLDARQERFTISRTTEKAVCPSCGSSDTVSNGKFRILCNSCGKQCQKSKVKQWLTITKEDYEDY
jgi:hypothetical protein